MRITNFDFYIKTPPSYSGMTH